MITDVLSTNHRSKMPNAILPTHIPNSNRPRTMVVMLAVMEGDNLNDEQLLTGTTGYVLRSEDPQMLLAAIRDLSQGNCALPMDIAQKVTLHMRPTQEESISFGLSHREKDVLRALVEGLSYKMIAHKLGITFETVRSHIKRIYSKMSVNNNTEAVAKAINGFVFA